MEYLGLEGGPPGFRRNSSCSVVLWCCRSTSGFAYETFTLSGLGFPTAHSARLPLPSGSPQPQLTVVSWFGLFRFRSPLLTESRLISLPGATEMFQFTPSPHLTLWIHVKPSGHLPRTGCPIRISADLWIFAPPRSFSQLVTSFFGSWYPGILPALFVT